MKVLIGAFNRKKALLGAFSLIVNFAQVRLKLYYQLWTKQHLLNSQHNQLQLQHQLIVLSDCDLIIASVEDYKYFVVVVTAVDSVVVVLIILRVQDYASSWIYNKIRILILDYIIVHCIFDIFWV